MQGRPHGSYALITGVYAALLGWAANRVSRDPELLIQSPPTRDLILLGLASFHLSRVVAYDKVTSVYRLPFVEEGKGPLHPEGTQEQARGSGMQLAIGQLLTCSPCLSAWAGALSVCLYTLSPRVGRLVMLVMAVSGMSQFLHPAFEAMMKLPGAVEKAGE